MGDDTATVHCSQCATAAEAAEGTAPLGWSVGRDERGITMLCPACARRFVRSIEAKLDESWW